MRRPEFFTNGARMASVDGENGKIDLRNLKAEIQPVPPNFIRTGQPMAIAQDSEIGTVYQPDEISEIANQYQLPLNMDGARFANALVALDLSPVEMT